MVSSDLPENWKCSTIEEARRYKVQSCCVRFCIDLGLPAPRPRRLHTSLKWKAAELCILAALCFPVYLCASCCRQGCGRGELNGKDVDAHFKYYGQRGVVRSCMLSRSVEDIRRTLDSAASSQHVGFAWRGQLHRNYAGVLSLRETQGRNLVLIRSKLRVVHCMYGNLRIQYLKARLERRPEQVQILLKFCVRQRICRASFLSVN